MNIAFKRKNEAKLTPLALWLREINQLILLAVRVMPTRKLQSKWHQIQISI